MDAHSGLPQRRSRRAENVELLTAFLTAGLACARSVAGSCGTSSFLTAERPAARLFLRYGPKCLDDVGYLIASSLAISGQQMASARSPNYEAVFASVEAPVPPRAARVDRPMTSRSAHGARAVHRASLQAEVS